MTAKTKNYQDIANEIHLCHTQGLEAKGIASYMKNKRGLDITEKSIKRQVDMLNNIGKSINKSRTVAEFLFSHADISTAGAERNIEIMHAILTELILTKRDGCSVHISPNDAFTFARTIECLVRAEGKQVKAKKKQAPKAVTEESLIQAMDIIGISPTKEERTAKNKYICENID